MSVRESLITAAAALSLSQPVLGAREELSTHVDSRVCEALNTQAWPEWLPSELMDVYVNLRAELPRFPTRHQIADQATRHLYPVSPRTLEAWPCVVRRINGHACYDREEVLERLFRAVIEAPPIRGGRSQRPHAHDADPVAAEQQAIA